MTTRVLIVDDDPLICEELLGIYRAAGFEALATEDPARLPEILAEGPFDLGVVDLKLPGTDGISLMEEMRARVPGMDVIMITGHGSIKGAVEAIRRGAIDYITKPFDRDEILLATQQALERRRLVSEIEYLRRQLGERYSFANMVSKNPAMLEIFALIEALGQNDMTVLIVGESGTGKELVARAIHFQGKRCNGRFVAINCGALPESLLESELFGFERGAFTGATREHIGKLEWASGGTLFLDEIESMPLSMQVKLLRALEERAIERLGGNRRIQVDIRVVAASNRDIERAVREGRMREDLYYRINVVQVRLPPLRERLEDIPLLVAHFLRNNPVAREKGVTGVSETALSRLMAHDWPGNVRELMNVIERALLRTTGPVIEEVDVGRNARLPSEPAGATAQFQVPLRDYVRAAERAYLAHLLERYRGSIGPSARHAAIDQATLHRKIKAHGLRPAEFRGRSSRHGGVAGGGRS